MTPDIGPRLFLTAARARIVIEAVAKATRLRPDDITGAGRVMVQCRARHAAAWLMRERFIPRPLHADIGAALGRHRTTIYHSLRQAAEDSPRGARVRAIAAAAWAGL